MGGRALRAIDTAGIESLNSAEAQAQVDALNLSALAADPYAQLVKDAGFHTQVRDQHAQFVAPMRPTLLLLQAGVLLLLLIIYAMASRLTH